MAAKLSVLTVSLISVFPLLAAEQALANNQFGDYGKETLSTLINQYAGRYSGTDKELKSGDYMKERMTFGGYNGAPQKQQFTFKAGRGVLAGQNVTSNNIVVTKQGVGNTGKTLYVGAHYDTAATDKSNDRSKLQGLDDNSSGAAVLTELARNLSGVETEHNLTFIGFGAEEYGLIGSKHFVSQMTDQEKKNAIGMINLDSLITGDKMYANSGDRAYDKAKKMPVKKYSELREHALRIAKEMGIDLQINKGDKNFPGTKEPYKPFGVGCCSDQESFDKADIPVLGFEATNWDIGDFDGYTQTNNPKIEGGKTWHDQKKDSYEYLTKAFGKERIDQRMRDFSKIISRLIVEQTNADVIQSMKTAAADQNRISSYLKGSIKQDTDAVKYHADNLALSPAAAERGANFWVDGNYRYNDTHDNEGNNNVQLGLYGEFAVQPKWAVGAGVSLKQSRNNDFIDKDNAYGVNAYSIYGGSDSPLWNVSVIGLHKHKLDLEREVKVGGGNTPIIVHNKEAGKTDATVFSLSNELGYNFIHQPKTKHGAYLGLNYNRAVVNAYDSGKNTSRTALHIDKTKDDQLDSELGYQIKHQFTLANRPVELKSRLAYVHEFNNKGIESVTAKSFADGKVREGRYKADNDKDYGKFRIGVNSALTEKLHAYLHADTTFAKKDNDRSVQVGVQYKF